MWQRICNHAAMLVLGVFVGMALTAGWLGLGQGISVDAMATHGETNFAIATGYVDNGIEAFYFLDFLTGDVRAAVISRRTGEFSALFEYNVQADFGSQTKNPKYLMVTGEVGLPRMRKGPQLGSALVYVAEASSGQVFAYALPWSSAMTAAGKPYSGSLLRVAGGSFRTTFIRDEE